MIYVFLQNKFSVLLKIVLYPGVTLIEEDQVLEHSTKKKKKNDEQIHLQVHPRGILNLDQLHANSYCYFLAER